MINWEFVLIVLIICCALYLFTSAAYVVSALIIGWNHLASIDAPDTFDKTKQFRMKRISIGKSGFPLGLDVKLSTKGLNLSLPWLFRFGLPAVYIPWEKIKPVGRYKFWLKPIEFIVFSVEFPHKTQIMIPSELLYSGEDYIPKAFVKSFGKLEWIIDFDK